MELKFGWLCSSDRWGCAANASALLRGGGGGGDGDEVEDEEGGGGKCGRKSSRERKAAARLKVHVLYIHSAVPFLPVKSPLHCAVIVLIETTKPQYGTAGLQLAELQQRAREVH